MFEPGGYQRKLSFFKAITSFCQQITNLRCLIPSMTQITRGGQPWPARSASFIATSILSTRLLPGAGFVAHADESSPKAQHFGARMSSVGSRDGARLGP